MAPLLGDNGIGGPFQPVECPMPRKTNPSPPPTDTTALLDAGVQVESFRQVREAHRLELIEDYVELISDLIAHEGEARQVVIAERMGVAQPTVAKMLQRLAREGYVVQRRYRGTFLTEAGEMLAAASRERHRAVEEFLLALGVPPDIARRDAEGMEHHVSEETLAIFGAFTRQRAG